MYNLIEKHIDDTIDAIPKDHFDEYRYLIQKGSNPSNPEYQVRYSKFFRLNGAGLSTEFRAQYFHTLKEYSNAALPKLDEVIKRIQTKDTKLHASFASKLLHMLNQEEPIYDSMICNFYFYSRPSYKDENKKIDSILSFHSFLKDEYSRIIKRGLLHDSITQLNDKWQIQDLSDIKKIDTLLWAFVKLMKVHNSEKRVVQYL